MRPTCAFSWLLLLFAPPILCGASLPDDIFKDGFEAPITATADTWTWVPFSDAFCGDGSTVGIGINPSSTGTRVLIYLEGGGACYDSFTCYSLQAARYFTTGYGELDFTAEANSSGYLAQSGGFFDRTSAANPFKDYSYVYVPYCTGDNHSGNNIVQLGANTAYFVGFDNMKAYLNRLYPTFRSADRVVLAGSDAGGFGATANWWQTQQAFGKIRVDMIDDSGTYMPPDIIPAGSSSVAAQETNWNLATTWPPLCTTCSTAIDTIFDFYSTAFPGNRGALLSYTQDTIVPSYYGISGSQFTTGLGELESSQFNATTNPNLAYFAVGSSGHVLWFNPTISTGNSMTGNFTLQQFITLMESDDPTWQSLHP